MYQETEKVNPYEVYGDHTEYGFEEHESYIKVANAQDDNA